jgi:hypothetical protein
MFEWTSKYAVSLYSACPVCLPLFRLYKAYLSKDDWVLDVRRADAIFVAAHVSVCKSILTSVPLSSAHSSRKVPSSLRTCFLDSSRKAIFLQRTTRTQWSGVNGHSVLSLDETMPRRLRGIRAYHHLPRKSLLIQHGCRESDCWQCAAFTRAHFIPQQLRQ